MNELVQQQFGDILGQIQLARQKAFKQVNSALIELYWNVGKVISEKVADAQWGRSVVVELAAFIVERDPDIKGFSVRNLWRMKQFYETYGASQKLSTLWTQLSWSHHRRIMTLKTEEEREFYLNLCCRENYSVRELDRLIDSSTFERTILSDQNLSDAVRQLPQSVEGVFKDSYIFDFLQLPPSHKEKELQDALLAYLKDFILELGGGFSFVGEEYRLQVGNDDFAIDLLFFHRQLQCLVAIELKTTRFKPDHLGRLEFYLEALDRDVKLPHENPSIGLLLCREKNEEVVEYALSRSMSPAVVAEYETKLIPKELLRRKLNEFYDLIEAGADQ